MAQRRVAFADYPASGYSYLVFDRAHGFQVVYLDQGRAFLWYPGNSRALSGSYRQTVVARQSALCWRYGANSRNPVTGQSGAAEACEGLEMARKRVIARLRGDVFALQSGAVPHPLARCRAPDAFQFDRQRHRC